MRTRRLLANRKVIEFIDGASFLFVVLIIVLIFVVIES